MGHVVSTLSPTKCLELPPPPPIPQYFLDVEIEEAIVNWINGWDAESMENILTSM
jgi:hypothetical protein